LGLVYDSKQIYWDLQQLNYDVKLNWIPSHVGISGDEVADGLARQAVESGTVHGQMTVANDHRIVLNKQWQEILVDLLIQSDLWFRSNHGLMDRQRRRAM
jgi:hypothetical protein